MTEASVPTATQRSGLSLVVGAWVMFFVGVGIEIGIDYALRIADGDVRTGGEEPWRAIHLGLSAVAIAGMFAGARRVEHGRGYLLSVALLIVGAFVYLAMCLAYTIGAGIDYF